MMKHPLEPSRRQFLKALAAGAALGGPLVETLAADEAKPKLKKAVKYGMIKLPGASIEEKFNTIKLLGF